MEKEKFGLIPLLEGTQNWWTKLRRRTKLHRWDCLVVGLRVSIASEWLDKVEDFCWKIVMVRL